MRTNHPTKELLINTTVDLMKTVPPEQLTSDLVLETSGITKGSLYHHFQDFAELLEYAHVRIFSRRVDEIMLSLEKLFASNSGREHLLREIEMALFYTNEATLAEERAARIRSIATTISSERATDLMGEEQGRLTTAVADLYRELQERGWANRDLDPLAVSIFVQTHSIGRIVDDFSEEPMNPESWRTLLTKVYSEVLFS